LGLKSPEASRNPQELFPSADLIRAIAIMLVILVHSVAEYPGVIFQIPQNETWRWWVANIYDSLARPGVPLFFMLSGALLLNPSKIEPLRVFFRKRLVRVGIPFLFWSAAYFAWREFVNHEMLTLDSIWHGFLEGPYFHFWFIYVLFGLYLVTPILRVFVAHANSRLLGYFIALWFVSTSIVPLLGRFASISFADGLFILTGFVGYFVLGAYLQTTHLRSWITYTFLCLGYFVTIVGTWFVTASGGGHLDIFFYDYRSVSVILASVALFSLLYVMPACGFRNRCSRAYGLFTWAGRNSLAIYMLHVIVLEALQRGLFGFTLSITTLNPVIEAPLITVATFSICLGVLWLLGKVGAAPLIGLSKEPH
jgi:surface polysaccharide O-acyltransferase-like enzyme